nr:alpha/beta fold hydrolase [Hoeflea prorocentri]
MELRLGGEQQPVEPQVFRLLLHLIENRDRLVTKDDLINAVWGGRIISDATLSSRISSARRAMGDSGTRQHSIRTIARNGYRFVAEVEVSENQTATPLERNGRSQDRLIRYCVAPDGVQLAYSITGKGPALVKTMSWLNHLEFDWESPVFSDLFQKLTQEHTLLRYDSRGAGLSDKHPDDFSFEALASDLETAIDASGLEKFALLGISQGAALAIDYAARYPQRVSHLLLWGGYARGRKRRGNKQDEEKAQAFRTLMRYGWGKDSSTFRQMFSALYLPEANEEQIRWWTELQRIATTPENAIRLRDTIDDIDVSDRLALVKAPTLILHSEREEVAPISEARQMAAKIPDATVVPLDSANHLVLPQETAWHRAVAAIGDFLQN